MNCTVLYMFYLENFHFYMTLFQNGHIIWAHFSWWPLGSQWEPRETLETLGNPGNTIYCTGTWQRPGGKREPRVGRAGTQGRPLIHLHQRFHASTRWTWYYQYPFLPNLWHGCWLHDEGYSEGHTWAPYEQDHGRPIQCPPYGAHSTYRGLRFFGNHFAGGWRCDQSDVPYLRAT